jgi:hypothetical protein
MKNKAAQSLGRLGGRATSEAKTKAARANGKQGGRPKLYVYACQVRRGEEWTTIGHPSNRAEAQEEAKRQRQWLREDDIDPVGMVRVQRFEFGA